jgi:hypothetical protein
MLPDKAAHERDNARRTVGFTQLLQNMEILAEGGSRPPIRGGARSR